MSHELSAPARNPDEWPRLGDATVDGVLPDGDILSCVIYTKPGRGAGVSEGIRGLPGVEVHCGADIDKLVVTVEDVADQPAADRLGALNRIEGVINTILIYHFGGQALTRRTTAACPDQC